MYNKIKCNKLANWYNYLQSTFNKSTFVYPVDFLNIIPVFLVFPTAYPFPRLPCQEGRGGISFTNRRCQISAETTGRQFSPFATKQRFETGSCLYGDVAMSQLV